MNLPSGALRFQDPVFYRIMREADLKSLLLQSSPSALMQPFLLWKLGSPAASAPTAAGFLLCTEGSCLPKDLIAPLAPSFRQALRSLVLAADGRPSLSEADLPFPLPPVEATSPPTPRLYPGRLLRRGLHLVAALGLQPADDPKESEIRVLLSIPQAHFSKVILEHLALETNQIRVSPCDEGRYWLWLPKPDLFLLLGYQNDPSFGIYQAFPEEPTLFTPWRKRSLLSRAVRLQSRDTLLVLEEDGTSVALKTDLWSSLQDLITLRDLPSSAPLGSLPSPPSIPVSLRFLPSSRHEIPTLWLLEGPTSLSRLETLFTDLPRHERQALSLFSAQRLPHLTPLFLLRDARPTLESPLFSSDAIGFESVLAHEGLFLRSGYRLSPSLSASQWREVFDLSPQRFTLLFPQPDSEATILSAPLSSFLPLESLVRILVHAHTPALQALASASPVDILFEPGSFSRSLLHTPSAEPPRLENKRDPRSNASPLTFRPQIPLQPLPKAAPRTPSLLRQTEDQLRRALQKGEALSLPLWLDLASLYVAAGQGNPDSEEISEALKALDEIFAVEPFFPDAVLFERIFLEEQLKIAGKSFAAAMQSLDQALRSESPTQRRLAWRLRVRMLLHDTERPEDEQTLLRLAFYRDLFWMEESLFLREHFTLVSEVAERLDDRELLERARLRYRSLLQNPDALDKAKPKISR